MSGKAYHEDVLMLARKIGLKSVAPDDLAVQYHDGTRSLWYVKVAHEEYEPVVSLGMRLVFTRTVKIEPATLGEFLSARGSVPVRLGQPSVILRSLPLRITERDLKIFTEGFALKGHTTAREEAGGEAARGSWRGSDPISLLSGKRETWAIVRLESWDEAVRLMRLLRKQRDTRISIFVWDSPRRWGRLVRYESQPPAVGGPPDVFLPSGNIIAIPKRGHDARGILGTDC